MLAYLSELRIRLSQFSNLLRRLVHLRVVHLSRRSMSFVQVPVRRFVRSEKDKMSNVEVVVISLINMYPRHSRHSQPRPVLQHKRS
jgi:hypothetical protein